MILESESTIESRNELKPFSWTEIKHRAQNQMLDPTTKSFLVSQSNIESRIVIKP
jgi:hypothetical protein